MIPAILLSFFLSLAGTGAYAWAAQRGGLLDRPGHRASHDTPTPTGAGIALVASLLITAWGVGVDGGEPRLGLLSLSASWAVVALPLALGLSLVGLADDRFDVSAWWRLLAQVLASGGLLVAAGVPGGLAPWSIPLLVLALVWTMNAVNFMDGSNGMAGMQGLFSAALVGGVSVLGGDSALAIAAFCLAAACAGFLPWNAPRARVFMGDAGSVPLGFLLGGLCIAGALRSVLPWPAAIAVLAVFHVDAGLTLLMRMRQGERWYTPHRRHVYQRLLAQGWSHGQVLLLYSALNVGIVAPGVMLGTIHAQWAWEIAAGVFVLLAASWYAVSLKLGEET